MKCEGDVYLLGGLYWSPCYMADGNSLGLCMPTVDPTLDPLSQGSLRNASGLGVKEGEESLP